MIKITGRNKRSVERDYKFYDPPEVIRHKIETPGSYRRSSEILEIRDRALMSCQYILAARVVEVTGGPTKAGVIPGLMCSNIIKTPDFLMVRGLRNVKHKFIKSGPPLKDKELLNQEGLTREEKFRLRGWREITDWRDYPMREEIPIPRQGGLSWIADNIEAQLQEVGSGELFKISPGRSYQIVREKTGEFNHYFKDMGLKLWYRLFNRDAFKLKKFSGHARWENLERYMGDIDQAKDNMLSWEGS